jgi:hypothetical protein
MSQLHCSDERSHHNVTRCRNRLAAITEEVEILRRNSQSNDVGNQQHGKEQTIGRNGKGSEDQRRYTKEELERERKKAAEKEAELLMEREQRALRDRQLAEEQRHAKHLAAALETARAENLALSQAVEEVRTENKHALDCLCTLCGGNHARFDVLLQAKEIGSMASKVAGGVLLCTVLWDASACEYGMRDVYVKENVCKYVVCVCVCVCVGIHARLSAFLQTKFTIHDVNIPFP